MAGKIQRGPYGMEFKLKGPFGPIRTERWYENRSDRERAFAALKGEHGAKLISSKRLGKK